MRTRSFKKILIKLFCPALLLILFVIIIYNLTQTAIKTGMPESVLYTGNPPDSTINIGNTKKLVFLNRNGWIGNSPYPTMTVYVKHGVIIDIKNQ